MIKIGNTYNFFEGIKPYWTKYTVQVVAREGDKAKAKLLSINDFLKCEKDIVFDGKIIEMSGEEFLEIDTVKFMEVLMAQDEEEEND